MKILLDEFNPENPQAGTFLESDGNQFMLRKYTGKVNEKSGELAFTTIGYYPKVSYALNRMVNLKLAQSEATTLAELRKEVEALRDWLHEQVSF